MCMADHAREVDKAALGQRIREAREQKGLSQPELGRLIGHNSGQQVWKYEHGYNIPEASTMTALAAALDTSVEWLLHGIEIEVVRRALQSMQAMDEDGSLGRALAQYLESFDADDPRRPSEDEEGWLRRLSFREMRSAGLEATPALYDRVLRERRAQQAGKLAEPPRAKVEPKANTLKLPATTKGKGRSR